MTRRRIAGVVLALALAGALSAGVASGVERVRGRMRKRPEPPPPFSQRDKVGARGGAEEGALPRDAVRRGAPESLAADGRPVALDAAGVSRPRGEREGRPAAVRAKPLPQAVTDGGAPEELESHAEVHAQGGLAGLTTRIPAPMRVSWTVVEPSAGRVRLVAEVERRLGFGAPVTVHLALPADARLLEGPAHFTVPEGQGGDIRAVSYVVAFGKEAPPSEDLVLVAHAEGASFGAHAEERYAFGRAPSSAPRPVPVGPVLPGSVMTGEEHGTPDGEGEDPAP
ncbi:hypothetical protein HPC49_00690 [Pyxidicoccus fallax]|uniref:Uncharacterized protein n=1 Tax=Pyxidicoccus fallax TaxID=394095 RepID=A0A848L7S7_9BACT|nr:hypothetical protein [Pyxidicoccus fallax]NMO14839.1 hypothetical protein [Pyxidicoccus fallax]NPC76770.1 hypothetical protein [Pyxidicoccus fallax]